MPAMYLVGPDPTDKTAVAYCASTDGATGVQSFSKGACANSQDLTFYSYASPIAGQVPMCFQPPPTGIRGTTVALSPTEQKNCTYTLNYKYQNLTCAETGCGDHGTCTNGLCVCTDNWTGSQCESPPSGNAGCTPDTDTKKSCGNQGSYGTCQAASSPQTGITGSGSCTCDLMTGQQGTFCEQHCTGNDGIVCGGPLRGYCVDGNYNYYTNPNAVKKRCACVNGWTGVDCTIPPPGWKCTADTDCTNVTTMNPTDAVPTGTCNKATGVCTCNNSLDCSALNAMGQAFTGQACQVPLPVQGGSCTQDSDCPSKDQQCSGGICSCSNTPTPSENYYLSVIEGVIKGLTSPRGIVGLASQNVLRERLPSLLKWLSVKALEKNFIKVIQARLENAVTGRIVDASASQFLENAVGKRLAAKVLANMSAKELMESSAVNLSSKVAETAFKEVFGFVGGIEGFLNDAGMLGMVLDSFDVMGLNEESTQSQIDSTILKFNAGVNSNKTILANGLQFPQKQNAESTFAFQMQKQSTASRNQFITDVGNYISHLTVNSNGAAIIPLFQTPVQQQQAALLAEAQGSVLYTLAGNNLDVYQRLKQDWPIIVAGILVAIGVLIGSAFGIKALVNKKKLSKQ